MAIPFYSILKANPKTKKKQYYASFRKQGTYELIDIAERISEGSTFTTGDVYGLQEGFTRLIPIMLMEGNHVKLGELGTYSLKINSRPEDTARKVDVWSILGTTMNFLPGKRVKRMLKSVKFTKNEKVKQTGYNR